MSFCLERRIFFMTYLRRRRGGGKNRNYPPVAGTVFHQLLHFRRLMEYQTELAHRYRTFRCLPPPRRRRAM